MEQCQAFSKNNFSVPPRGNPPAVPNSHPAKERRALDTPSSRSLVVRDSSGEIRVFERRGGSDANYSVQREGGVSGASANRPFWTPAPSSRSVFTAEGEDLCELLVGAGLARERRYPMVATLGNTSRIFANWKRARKRRGLAAGIGDGAKIQSSLADSSEVCCSAALVLVAPI